MAATDVELLGATFYFGPGGPVSEHPAECTGGFLVLGLNNTQGVSSCLGKDCNNSAGSVFNRG